MKKGAAIGIGCLGIIVLVVIILFFSIKGTYNRLVTQEEAVTSQWAQVENQYQRRADLIPNLVATVKGFAAQEKDVLQSVVAERAKVGSMQVSPDILNNPEAFQQFQQAQSGLSSALSRLMVVVERYPELKSNQNFLELQSQLEGAENRITVARMRFVEAAQAYNTSIRRFPANLFAGFFGFEKKQYFEADAGSEEAPVVDFGQ
ncbi:MAG: LemA family protein [Acidobacteria bacterium]|nr:LemA family protein [Acidobacteriota bacterium]